MSSFVQATAEQLALNDKLCPYIPAKGPMAVWPDFDPSHRQFTDEGMSIEFNHDIPLRDGVVLRGDIYLPAHLAPVASSTTTKKLPIVLALTPFGKQNPFDMSQIPPTRNFDPGFTGVHHSKYMPFEGSDPKFWTSQGFAYVAVDARGSFASQGDKASFLVQSDALDGYDVVEYLATRPWSNGRVGMIGASGLGVIQWHVAALRPPHLAGLLVQDAYTDFYRDVAFKSGVLHGNFLQGLDTVYAPHGNREGCPKMSMVQAAEQHPYDDEMWALFRPDVARIVCPVYVVCSLADNGVHTPGSIRGYLAVASEVKYLELHPYRKWEWQITPESLERQAAWFNAVLDGPDTHAARSVEFWPKVRLHVTEKHYAGSWRSESAWPLPSTVRTQYALHEDGTLSFMSKGCQQPGPGPDDEETKKKTTTQQGSLQYDALTGSLSWKITFDQPTEIVGSSKLHLDFSIAARGGSSKEECDANDATLFVTLQKLDRDGRTVAFPYHSFVNDGHVAYGWMQASKRALASHAWGDEVTYTFLEKDASFLTPNEPVTLDINIQPSATLFRKGESLVLAVQGRDFGEYDPGLDIPRAGTGCNKKGLVHVVHLAGSYLEVPIIPSRF